LLRPREDFYAQGHPRPEDVLLIVEVADTTEDFDREIKVPLYARTGIPEVWVVVLADEHIEVYRRPTPQGYRERQTLRRGQRLTPQSLPDLELVVEAVL